MVRHYFCGLTQLFVVVVIPMFVVSIMFNRPFWFVKSPNGSKWLVQVTIVTISVV